MNSQLLNILGLTLASEENLPFLVLQTGAGQLLPVEIGPAEASGLLLTAEGIHPLLPGPLELFIRALDEAALQITQVEITGWDHVGPQCFLHLEKNRRPRTPWAVRASDGLTLAVRLGVPVTITPQALEEGVSRSEASAVWSAEGVVVPLCAPEQPRIH